MSSNGPVEIVLDRPRTVRYTFADLKGLQRALGKPMAQVVADMGQLDVVALQHVLYAGLRHEDKRLRLDDVGEMIQKFIDGGKTLGDIYYVVNQGLVESGFFGREEGDRGAAAPSA